MLTPFSLPPPIQHTSEDDIWLIVDHQVYDVSDFLEAHPGGEVVLRQVAGQDATEAFYNLHRQQVLTQYKALCLGPLEGETPEVITPQPGDLSTVPYAEPLWLSPVFKSPYYNESHRRLQKAVREFTEVHILPEAKEKEEDGTQISQELINKMADVNLLACRLGPGKHLRGRTLFGGVVKGEEYDYFHDLIVSQEIVRTNMRGFQDGNMAGMTISLTAVHQWCRDEELRERVSQEVLSGKKKICLAVTEAFAGSDVAGLRTTATLSEDGEFYVVNGTKKVRRSLFFFLHSSILTFFFFFLIVDHQRHLLRLLRHGLQIRQRLHRPPHRTRLQRRNQTHQNLLLNSSRNNLHRIQQRQSPQTKHSRSRTRRFPSHHVQLVPLPSPLFLSLPPTLTNTLPATTNAS